LPSYIGERRTTFAKAYGIKVRCYEEHVGEHIGNLKGTHWEPGEYGKKTSPLECMLGAFPLAA